METKRLRVSSRNYRHLSSRIEQKVLLFHRAIREIQQAYFALERHTGLCNGVPRREVAVKPDQGQRDSNRALAVRTHRQWRAEGDEAEVRQGQPEIRNLLGKIGTG